MQMSNIIESIHQQRTKCFDRWNIYSVTRIVPLKTRCISGRKYRETVDNAASEDHLHLNDKSLECFECEHLWTAFAQSYGHVYKEYYIA